MDVFLVQIRVGLEQIEGFSGFLLKWEISGVKIVGTLILVDLRG